MLRLRRAWPILLTFAIVMSSLLPVEAGTNTWTTSGPTAPGVILHLALDPTREATVYAAGSSNVNGVFTPRVFKSTDRGASWTDVTNGIVNVAINAIAVDPTNGLNIYVGGYNPIAKSLALYRSTDGGASWRLLAWPMTGADLDRQVLAIALNPTTGQIVYVGTSNGALRSTDGGTSWTQLTTLPPTTAASIVIERANPSIVWIAGYSGVFRSTDGGATWSAASNGIPFATDQNGLQVYRVNNLAPHPTDPRVMYASVTPATGGDLVFRTNDAGANWVSASSGLPNDAIRDIAVDPLQPQVIYAALNGGSGNNLMRSTDAGAGWTVYSLPGGGYSSSIAIDMLTPQTIHVAHNDAVWSFTSTPDPSPTPVATGTPVATATPTSSAPPSSRFFNETGYRIDDDAFWDYFVHRGGVRMFGYPTSRSFLFLGFQSQFFQRAIMQKAPDGSVRLLNLLDPGLLQYTSFNGASIPAADPALIASSPAPGSAGYDTAVINFVRANAPNTVDGQPVRFEQTFQSTVTMEIAFPQGGGSPALLPGINLELWGIPTSRPAYDPNNRNFIYQRFQRGIMHYDAGCQCTNGLLLADYLKAVITGQNLPADVAAQAAGSRFFQQYDPSKPSWVARPDALPDTDLTNAFTPST